ncbi:uncharacterized protein MONBRDRAFT_34754 [Monosiga brevicollis MX1]|uniref:Citramalyl-CoA lyase, mitochondrial n=1 Tax=Monosiga brevicollis TaxID=81824 RepID=A9VDU1_MONBE|nr:uncharacterized protein MONBRDRAFT_34754 [Monosiga brevicollis MX1]EDQ84319.1 predicted protein [Monosiga brevicollis MX1]|eukprot:XP_001750889.1 hypothetical protein [Monosiga brevicollis MX1]
MQRVAQTAIEAGKAYARLAGGDAAAGGDGAIGLLRRALLYLPAHDHRKVVKASTLDVDLICLDCEDAVAEARKPDARQAIPDILSSTNFGRSEVAVRINPVDTPHAWHDLEAVLGASTRPHTIVVPKVDTPEQMEWLYDAVQTLSPDSNTKPLHLITQVESAVGLHFLHDICQVGKDRGSAEDRRIIHDGLILGGDDFAASIRARRTPSNRELLLARQQTIVAAARFGLTAIDIVNIHYKQGLDLLEQEASEGAEMGFDGKQVIHPVQVPIVQAAYHPTPQQIDYARRLVDAFNAHSDAGTGAFEFEGTMVDMPTVRQHQQVLWMDNHLQAAAAQK